MEPKLLNSANYFFSFRFYFSEGYFCCLKNTLPK